MCVQPITHCTRFNLRPPTGQLEPVSDENGLASGLPGEPKTPFTGPITSVQDFYDAPIALPTFSPEHLMGLMFLYEVNNGQRVQAKFVKKVLDWDAGGSWDKVGHSRDNHCCKELTDSSQ